MIGNGDIYAAWTNVPGTTQHGKISGGTGAYKRANGTIVITMRTAKTALVTIRYS